MIEIIARRRNFKAIADEIFRHIALEILYIDGEKIPTRRRQHTIKIPFLKGQSNKKPCMKKQESFLPVKRKGVIIKPNKHGEVHLKTEVPYNL